MPIASADVVRALVILADAVPGTPPPVSRISGLLFILIVLSILVLSSVMWAVMRTARRVSRGRREIAPPQPTRQGPDAWFEAGKRMPIPPDPASSDSANPHKGDPS